MGKDYDSLMGQKPSFGSMLKATAGAVAGVAKEATNPDAFKGETADAFFSASGPGKVLSAFGQGASQGWGAGNDPKLREKLTDPDTQQDWSSVHKVTAKFFNEAFLRPLATATDIAVKSGTGTLGAVFGGAGAAIGQTGLELQQGAQKLNEQSYGKAPAALLGEAGDIMSSTVPQADTYTDPYTGKQTESGTWGFLPESSIIAPAFATRATAARAKGLIGEGEEGFFNTQKISPEDLLERREAAQEAGVPFSAPVPPEETARLRELKEETRRKLEAERINLETGTGKTYDPNSGKELDLSGAQPTTVDIGFPKPSADELNKKAINRYDLQTEALAREIDPDTFNKLDELRQKQAALRASAEYLKSQKLETIGNREEFKAEQKRQADFTQNVQDLQNVDVELRDIHADVASAKERGRGLYESYSPEGQIFRDYIHSKLEEARLNQEADLAADHANDLLDKKTPQEAAEIVLDDQKAKNENPSDTNKPGSVPAENAQEVAEAKQQLGITTLYRGEPAPDSLEAGVSMSAAERGRWYSHSLDTAKAYAGEKGKVHSIDIPDSELEGSSEKYRLASNGEERLLHQDAIDKYLGKKEIGTGEAHPMGISQATEDWAVSQELADEILMPETQRMSLKDQDAKWVKLINDDPQKAFRIIMGGEELPEGFHGIRGLNKMMAYAKSRQDLDMVTRLLNSPYNRELSESARNMRAIQDRDPYDINAEDRLQEIIDFRKQRMKSEITNEAFKAGEVLKTYMEKASTSVDDAINYIRSIECDY